MSFVGKYGRLVAAAVPLVFVAIVAVVTYMAASSGACSDGDLRPSCSMFATAILLYSLVAVGAVTALATLALLLLRRKPPKLLILSSVLRCNLVSLAARLGGRE
jgi:hypothetical protein